MNEKTKKILRLILYFLIGAFFSYILINVRNLTHGYSINDFKFYSLLKPTTLKFITLGGTTTLLYGIIKEFLNNNN